MPLNPPAAEKRASVEQRLSRINVSPAFILGQITGALIVLLTILATR